MKSQWKRENSRFCVKTQLGQHRKSETELDTLTKYELKVMNTSGNGPWLKFNFFFSFRIWIEIKGKVKLKKKQRKILEEQESKKMNTEKTKNCYFFTNANFSFDAKQTHKAKQTK